MSVELQILLNKLAIKPNVEYGCCHCGCGEKTVVPKRNDASHGYVRDIPNKWMAGHSRRKFPRIQVDEQTQCWVWQNHINRVTGYGDARTDGPIKQHKLAHRMTWEYIYGDIPDGFELDHLCRNRPCVNPEHLRIVTRRENTQCGRVAVLDPDKVREIRKLRATGLRCIDISKLLCLKYPTVQAVVSGNSWSNIGDVDAGIR